MCMHDTHAYMRHSGLHTDHDANAVAIQGKVLQQLPRPSTAV